MSQTYRLRIAGIGGQGVVHLATTIAAAAAAEGVSVSVIERPRSAMRLGPITCDVCLGQTGFGPFIVPGEADVVLGMEPLDGVMNAAYLLKENGTMILQNRETPTIDEIVSETPDVRRQEWKDQIEQRGGRVILVDTAGTPELGRNYYMLGALLQACPDFPVSAAALEQELAGQEANQAALAAGLTAAL